MIAEENRVLKCDVIKKIQSSISGQIVSEIVAQLCSNDSIITNPSRFHSVPNELSQICQFVTKY